jgi:hypothetical protein
MRKSNLVAVLAEVKIHALNTMPLTPNFAGGQSCTNLYKPKNLYLNTTVQDRIPPFFIKTFFRSIRRNENSVIRSSPRKVQSNHVTNVVARMFHGLANSSKFPGNFPHCPQQRTVNRSHRPEGLTFYCLYNIKYWR